MGFNNHKESLFLVAQNVPQPAALNTVKIKPNQNWLPGLSQPLCKANFDTVHYVLKILLSQYLTHCYPLQT